ncbi:hypothetical protein M747DRAFT_292525 [Aspergillus niger ATCC 13496]|uniref:Uncharacterized protein n=1 Tax=Aspergillus niger ATCC 13496 TaxID=1353008 RepID=A0A370CF81_ASPNG|nr:hypothetical protein M747DRAFT_292525 [Aspergillus niger ATCC 13496]
MMTHPILAFPGLVQSIVDLCKASSKSAKTRRVSPQRSWNDAYRIYTRMIEIIRSRGSAFPNFEKQAAPCSLQIRAVITIADTEGLAAARLKPCRYIS